MQNFGWRRVKEQSTEEDLVDIVKHDPEALYGFWKHRYLVCMIDFRRLYRLERW